MFPFDDVIIIIKYNFESLNRFHDYLVDANDVCYVSLGVKSFITLQENHTIISIIDHFLDKCDRKTTCEAQCLLDK